MLISAYGCEPGKGSEQGVGWHWTMQLAHDSELVVLTRSNNEEAIRGALPPEVADNVRFEFYDLPAAARKLKRKERGLYFFYLFWQWGAYRRARVLARQSRFDYAMHLTFGSIWMPTFMHLLPIPFIWGPVGGGEGVPFALIRTLSVKGRASQYLRYFLIATIGLNPLLMGVIRRARLILARTDETARLIPDAYSEKVRVVLETSMADDILASTMRTEARSNAPDLRVIYTGRLIPLKNLALGIRAVAMARRHGAGVRLTVVGDGPLRKSLEKLAHDEGIAEFVDFLGNMPQADVLASLRESDAYLFPSLKEGGVWSLMEAMAASLPVVCVDGSGMSVITDETCAIRVVPTSEEAMMQGFVDALLRLAESPQLRIQLGTNGRRRIEEQFRWEHKRQFMAAVFRDIEHVAE
ncbi:glycosyltransferase [Ramlibacter ginsenosidimutans]|uniref:Glycosyltransferase n=1 Tax=Ramlibacter ginsenosidimutans TaxID=502333 RepID=A0A934TSR7_9BURK|nr:glycosyltransferase [Ramlibacter ginsenosidimutans]MBK6006673.1 glycosyltransferase [Ramlibacter ginsenosidimutans]